jgi:putative phosphoesterase
MLVDISGQVTLTLRNRMRIGVLADIHGNLRALEAVQADLRKQSPDLVVNLGDHLSGPLQAAATADILMGEKYLHIRGNHDRQLVDRAVEAMGASDRAAFGQLEKRHRIWLENLPVTLQVEPGILLCHGSPGDDLRYLLEEVGEHGVHLAPAARIRDALGNTQARLILCGHSHIPRAVTIGGGVQIVNPGSVGLPAYDDVRPWPHYMETGSPHARYAVLEKERTGWKFNMIALEYDWNSAAADAAKAGRPDWAHALATGFALRP